MATTAQALIDTSLAQLQSLSACLVSELSVLHDRTATQSLEARACKELLLCITVLVPKLQAARYVVGAAAPPPGRCAQCEEG